MGFDPSYAERESGMTHIHHVSHQPSLEAQSNLNRLAARATNHCLTGCLIGEVVGMTIATALDWGDAGSIALAVGLAFLFGYALTSLPLFRAGLPFSAIVPIALAAARSRSRSWNSSTTASCCSCRALWKPV
jgi:hypothetical protein